MPRSAHVVAALAGVLALVVAGCGRSVPAPQWAAKACSTLIPWRGQITDLNHQAQQRLATATTPDQTRDQLVALLDGAEQATEAARASLAAAGAPDIDGGADLAGRIVGALERIRDAYARALAALRAIPTSAATYYDQVAAVLTALTQEYERTAVDPSALASPDMQAAFAGQAQCQ